MAICCDDDGIDACMLAAPVIPRIDMLDAITGAEDSTSIRQAKAAMI